MDSHSLGRPVATVKGARSAGIAPVSVSHHPASPRPDADAATGRPVPSSDAEAAAPSSGAQDPAGDASGSEPSQRVQPASAGPRGEC